MSSQTAPTQILYVVLQNGDEDSARLCVSRAAVIRDIMSGEIEDPARVFEAEVGAGFNDISEDIARDIANIAQRDPISYELLGFIEHHAGLALGREMVMEDRGRGI